MTAAVVEWFDGTFPNNPWRRKKVKPAIWTWEPALECNYKPNLYLIDSD